MGLDIDGRDGTFTRVLTDTRAIEPGALFVALAGDRFDGHDYLEVAAAAGATGAVVREGTRVPAGMLGFEVPDTLRAFGHLARARRRQTRRPGDRGDRHQWEDQHQGDAGGGARARAIRTTPPAPTSTTWSACHSPSWRRPADTEALVVEAGANLPGEIARYREIIEPSLAIVTNAVAGHLEGFGSLAGVVEEKLSLTDGVPLAIVGIDPPELADGARRRARAVRTAALAGRRPRARRRRARPRRPAEC